MLFTWSAVRLIRSRRIRREECFGQVGKVRSAYRILFGRHEVYIPFTKRSCKWEGDIKVDFKQVGFVCADWIHVVHYGNRWWSHGSEPSEAIICWVIKKLYYLFLRKDCAPCNSLDSFGYVLCFLLICSSYEGNACWERRAGLFVYPHILANLINFGI